MMTTSPGRNRGTSICSTNDSNTSPLTAPSTTVEHRTPSIPNAAISVGAPNRNLSRLGTPRRLPMAVRNPLDQSLATQRTPAQPRHVRLAPRLIHKDQPTRIVTRPPLPPGDATRGDVRPILLAAWTVFFCK